MGFWEVGTRYLMKLKATKTTQISPKNTHPQKRIEKVLECLGGLSSKGFSRTRPVYKIWKSHLQWLSG